MKSAEPAEFYALFGHELQRELAHQLPLTEESIHTPIQLQLFLDRQAHPHLHHSH